ncbi:hypothetical protein N9098_01610 [bacterium]|nr:hypothetical protein [bacterium]
MADQKRLWVISVLTSYLIGELQDEEGDPHSFKPLYSQLLKKILGTNYAAVIKDLVSKGLVERLTSPTSEATYDKARHVSKSFRLCEKYRTEIIKGDITQTFITNTALLQRRDKSLKEHHHIFLQQNSFVDRELNGIEGLRFQEEAAKAFVEDEMRSGLLSKHQHLFLQENIYHLSRGLNESNDFLSFKEKDGRVYSILTNSKRTLRQFILDSEGHPLEELDMRSAQLVLLCQLLALCEKNRIQENILSSVEPLIGSATNILEDLSSNQRLHVFAQFVLGSDFYSTMGGSTPKQMIVASPFAILNPEDRKRFKTLVIKRILYGWHSSQDVFKPQGATPEELKLLQKVEIHFPSVILFLKRLADECRLVNNKDVFSRPACLSRLLSKLEGHFFHKKLPEIIYASIPNLQYFILHDAVYVQAKYKDRVVDLLDTLTSEYFGCKGLFSSLGNELYEQLACLEVNTAVLLDILKHSERLGKEKNIPSDEMIFSLVMDVNGEVSLKEVLRDDQT